MGSLLNSLKVTNLDVEDSLIDGGTPYKQDKDPTVYPVLAKASTPVSGYFATKGKAASKFNQIYTPTNTYLDSFSQQIGGGNVLPTIGTRDSGVGNINPRVPIR